MREDPATPPTVGPRPRHGKKAQRRPRFELATHEDVTTVLEKIRANLELRDDIDGMVLDSGRIELTSSREDVRFWSPQLTIDAVAEGEGCLLRARFGPHPHVWTLYLALHATSVAFALGCAMYGASQWTVGADPWVLWLIPASLVLSGLVYGASFVGQGLGALEMLELRSFVETAIRCEGEGKVEEGSG